jgi:hypothetical protein
MIGGGAERDVEFAPPGFQHRQQSSTNGLARQQKQHATTSRACHASGLDLQRGMGLLEVCEHDIATRRQQC